jgi:hypothetical protein
MKLNEHYDRIIEILLERKKNRCWKGYKPTPGVKRYAKGSCQPVSEAKSPAWQRKEGKSESGGLNAKGIASYRRENPGSKLSMAVTEKNPKGKRAERQKAFCLRMGELKKKRTSKETARDPNSRINKALRKWNC